MLLLSIARPDLELLARITVALRGSTRTVGKTLVHGSLHADPVTRQVTDDGTEVRLTRTEFAILRLLMDNLAQVVTKTSLLERISTDTPDCTESSLKTHVSNLSKKLRDAGAGDPIEAVWGIGFKLKES